MPRALAILAMLGLVACATIAGLEAPAELEESTNVPDRTPPAPTSSSTTTPPPQQTQNADASATPTEDAAIVTDAGTKDADAAVQPPPCTKTTNGGGCTDGISCCSGKCNEAKLCASDCRGGGSSCDPTASAPCCVGLYCTGLCIPCIGQGGTAADAILGGKNSKSCCSRMVGGDGKCL